jgi:hypothetical protein
MEEPPGQLHGGGAIAPAAAAARSAMRGQERRIWRWAEAEKELDRGREKSQAAAGRGRAARWRAVGRDAAAGVTQCFFPGGDAISTRGKRGNSSYH